MIYFMQHGENGPIKIGYTSTQNSISSKLKTMSSGTPEILELLALVDGTLNDESALHQKFKQFRIKNEWFYPDVSLLNFIKNPDIKASSKEYVCKCKLCGYQWGPRKSNPKACPSCKRYDWNTTKPET